MSNKPSREELLARAQEEDQMPDELLSAEQIARKKARLKKRTDRKQEKQEKAAAAEHNRLASMSNDEWFEHNRAELEDTQRLAHDAREAEVLELMFELEDAIAGKSDVTRDLIFRVEESVKQNGTCYWNLQEIPALSTKQDRLDEWTVNDSLSSINAAKTLLRYGYAIALDNQTVIDFQVKFVRPKEPRYEWVQMNCIRCDRLEARTTVPKSIADSYAAKGKPYRCHQCLDTNQKMKAISLPDEQSQMNGSPGKFVAKTICKVEEKV